MMRGFAAMLLLGLLGATPALSAPPAFSSDDDTDLNRIPARMPAETPPEQASVSSKDVNYISDALQSSAIRKGLAVPFPSPSPPTWENWLFLDTRDEWKLGDDWRLDYSGRMNFRTSNSIPFPTHENVRNDLRELFVEWQPTGTVWLEVGRVNIRNGVALGFNPTDFFRPRTVIEPLTADPSVLREDRLGSLMITGQALWSLGSVTAAYAPKVTNPSAIYNIRDEQSFNPGFDRTNAMDRFMVKTSLNLAAQFNPELLYYHAGNRTQLGANLTTPIGRSIVAYAEWSGGNMPDMITDAFHYGEMTGALPATVTRLLPNSSDPRFMNDLSIGASYANSANMTFNLEYHYHEAGFSSTDWSNWFNASARLGSIPGVNNALWYLRSYAQDQQEPMSKHAAFVRFDWQDALIKDLELTAIATVNLQDASGFAQVTAEYHLSRAWTVAGLVSGAYGGRRSEWGSLPGVANFLLRANRYF
jgi:hypothetical protein